MPFSSTKYSTALFAGLLVSCATVPTVDKVADTKISGNISIADSSKIPAGISVSVNGQNYDLNSDGSFLAATPHQDYYQIQFSGPDIFTSTYTFSETELKAPKGALSVPEIELVAKTPERRLLTFGGDFMMGRRYLEPRWNETPLIRPETRLKDMKHILAPMKPYFEPADFAAVNLESILAETEPPDSAPKSVVFFTHPDATKALEWMGTDYVSLGNNHTYDYVEEGLDLTLKALAKSNLDYSGAGPNENIALQSSTTDLDGIDVKAWGYVGWKGRVEPNQVAEPQKGGAAYGSVENIQKSLIGHVGEGQIDIVQYHGSREYSEGPTEVTEERLKAAVDNGADLVVAHHPHVSQGLELYNNKLIAYSLGNFAFDQFFYSTHAAIALNVWMDGDEFYRAEVIPVHVKGYRPTPAMNNTREYILDRVTRLSADRGTHVSLNGGHGVITQKNMPDTNNIVDYKDIFFVGDFESNSAFGGDERSWFVEKGSMTLSHKAKAGRYALEITPESQALKSSLGLKTFMRVFPQNAMELSADIKAQPGTKISAYAQYRPRKMNRYKALDEQPWIELGSFEISDQNWQSVNFDFTAPTEKFSEARFIFKFSETGAPILIDNVEMTPKP